ncbi:MAG: metallophosphoesterase family protein [Candidatus Zixiibacteriota bacterium]
MKSALISDIHANLEALEAVLIDIGRHPVDRIICLGDVIGYGCNPIECLRLVNENCQVKLLGNHEYAALGLMSEKGLNELAQESLIWTRGKIGDREIAIISDFEMDYEFGDNYFVHASPHEPEAWHYILTMTEAVMAFEAVTNKICFFGHTHVPMIFSVFTDGRLRQTVGHDFLPDEENRYLVNIGSVGQPRDNDPRACYVIYDDEEKEILYHRVEYDVTLTQRKMTRENIPSYLIERLSNGR